MSSSLTNPPIKADTAWKLVLDRWFHEFLLFFYPNIASKINWVLPVEVLDQELLPLTTDAMVGKQLTDKLFKVHALDGQLCYIILHIEVQGDRETRFETRLFEYSYRLYDRYKCPILTLAVLTDDSPHWRPNHYQAEVWGYKTHHFDFYPVKLLDYQSQADQLLTADNPFAVIVSVHLSSQTTRTQPEQRFHIKFAIFKQLLKQGWGRDAIRSFYTFMDGVMRLPEELEIQYHHSIYQLEKVKGVDYITSAERFGIEKGMQQGMQQGMRNAAKRMMAQGSDNSFIQLITGLSSEELADLKSEQ